jgi:hypothetical protein
MEFKELLSRSEEGEIKKPRVLWLTHSPRPAVRYRPLPTSVLCPSSLRNLNKVRSFISLAEAWAPGLPPTG